MAWSIFTDGGGGGAAVTWARDLLSQLGVPVSGVNVQFIYDWELAEGGGGRYNPLNQGPVPWNSTLTSTGSQYGGGAADYVSWAAGLQGAADYLHMSSYAGILAGLGQSDYWVTVSALVASPWAASHYGYGANWPNQPAPGAGQLTGGGIASIAYPGISGTLQGSVALQQRWHGQNMPAQGRTVSARRAFFRRAFGRGWYG